MRIFPALVDTVSTVAVYQVLAPKMVLDLPSFHSLRITKFEILPREQTSLLWGRYIASSPQIQPNRLVIYGESLHENHSHAGTWSIAINLENGCFGDVQWESLIHDKYYGSAALGLFLIGFPSLLFSSPILVLFHIFYAILKMISGMDKHSYTAYMKLRKQLPESMQASLKEAFLNHFNGKEFAWTEQLRQQDLRDRMNCQ